MIRNLIRSLIRRGHQPGPRVQAQFVAEMQEVPALTLEETILLLRGAGCTYREIQAQTGATYHKVRKTCMSA